MSWFKRRRPPEGIPIVPTYSNRHLWQCNRPPYGWTCPKHAGHEGPCPASPPPGYAAPDVCPGPHAFDPPPCVELIAALEEQVRNLKASLNADPAAPGFAPLSSTLERMRSGGIADVWALAEVAEVRTEIEEAIRLFGPVRAVIAALRAATEAESVRYGGPWNPEEIVGARAEATDSKRRTPRPVRIEINVDTSRLERRLREVDGRDDQDGAAA